MKESVQCSKERELGENEMKNNYKRILRGFIFCLPLLIGACGFYFLEGETILDALFYALGFYVLNNTSVPPNVLVEVARWTAPLVTASGIILIFAELRQRIWNWFKYIKGGSVAVYGPEEEVSRILAELGKKGIRGTDPCVHAERYILLGSEEENFAFYQENQAMLEDKMVYMKCDSMNAWKTGANLKLFHDEETAARLFWKQAGLHKEAKQKQYRLKIVFSGFGRLEQELLLWGLQDNIFDADQCIEYHIFGDGSRFQAVYHELKKIEDPVIFHEEPWYENPALLEEADRVLVCGKTDILREMLFVIPGKTLDVLTEDRERTELLEEQERLRIFYWREEAQKLCNILDDVLLERAKRINLRYANIYCNVVENEQNKEAEWKKLDGFTRYSNISAADYHEIRLQMLEAWETENGKSGPDDAYMERMAELEHIRWCRYHYLNNWRYGIPENGKNKDKTARIHEDLVPYRKLSEEDKEKDRENIRILLGV